MHLNLRGHRFRVLLVYTTTLTALFAAGCWGSTQSTPHGPHVSLHAHTDSAERTHAGPVLRQPGDTTQAAAFGRRHRARVAASSRLRHGGEREYYSLSPSDEACSEGNIKYQTRGSFYIVGQLQPNLPNMGYQSDSARPVQGEGGKVKVRGQRLRGSEESWPRLQPVVECGGDAMVLNVRRRRAGPLLLNPVNESSIPLSQLPPHCGYSAQTTSRDLSLMVQYDACHVRQEDDSYVLPLLWRGTPVEMSCPVSQTQARAMGLFSLCCSQYGMTVKGQELSPEEELKINVRGEWTPFVLLAEQCGFSVDSQDAEIMIAAPYLTCGMTVKNGKYTLNLQIGEKTFTLSCPVSEEHQQLTNQPTENPSAESQESFQWAAPYYLAPLYYPHPTYHQTLSRPDAHDAQHSLPSSLTLDPTFGPQPLPPVDPQPVYQEYESLQIPVKDSNEQNGAYDSLSSTYVMEDSSPVVQVYPDEQKPEKPTAKRSPSSAPDFVLQVEPPLLQPQGHTFNPYYHYYHHPKIPLPSPLQDPDQDPEVTEKRLTTSDTHEFPMFSSNVHGSEDTSDDFPEPQVASHLYIPPTSHPFVQTNPDSNAPYMQPDPYQFLHYVSHIVRGEAKMLPPLHPDTAAKTDSYHVHPYSNLSEPPVQTKYDMDPYFYQPNSGGMINIEQYRPEWIRDPPLSEDVLKNEMADKGTTHVTSTVLTHHPLIYPSQPDFVWAPPLKQPSPSTPPIVPPHYPSYYHPYYRMYVGHDGLQSADNRVSAAAAKQASDPLLQASSSPVQHPSSDQHQTTTSPTESLHHLQNNNLHPYYYYYNYYSLLNNPDVSNDNQEQHPVGDTLLSEPHLPSDSEHSRMDLLVQTAEAGYPSIPQPTASPFHRVRYHYVSQQLPYEHLGHLGGEEAEEEPDHEIKDHLRDSTPSASPCGLGPVSEFDCSNAVGCCLHTVKAPQDCTVGRHFVFVMPDSVSESTVAPPPPPFDDSEVSCTLQKLTYDPGIYIVPLDGCGVNKHMFDQNVLHLLDVQGMTSVQQEHSSPDRLHVTDPPAQIQSTPATVTVQLRIATDEFFTSYHPEAHLPLSLIQGRPLYMEVSLLDPPENDLVLLVHSCLAYTQAPYISWMPIYDGCPSRHDSQLLPSPNPHHIRRITILSFLSLPSESSPDMAKEGYSEQDDLEVYFLCSAEVCSSAYGDCTVGCINSRSSDM